MRLDIYITKLHPEMTRSQAKRLVEGGHVKVNGVVVDKVSRDIKNGVALELAIPP